jgi:hypothetical protein
MDRWLRSDGTVYEGKAAIWPDGKGYAFITEGTRCRRCGGAGGSDAWKYTGWTCYDCGGTGNGPDRTTRLYDEKKFAALERRRAKAEAKRIAKQEERERELKAEADERRAGFAEANPELLRLLEKHKSITFVYNMNVAVEQAGALTLEQAAAVWKWLNNAERDERERETCKHVGEEGKRMTLLLTCERVIPIGTSGPRWAQRHRYLSAYRDEEGNVLSLFSTATPLREGEQGELAFTVKEHGEYRGKAQTIIQRPRLKESTVRSAGAEALTE